MVAEASVGWAKGVEGWARSVRAWSSWRSRDGAAGDRVALREVGRPGEATRVVGRAEGRGDVQAGRAPGRAGAEAAGPEGRDPPRVRRAGRGRSTAGGCPGGRSGRSSRPPPTINGEVRPSASALRAELATLVAERREGVVEVVSPGGPLTRSELELVQGPGDPLALASLLPDRPVAVGDRWTVGDLAARNLSGYDALAANALEATLEALDDASARVRLLGHDPGRGAGRRGVDGLRRVVHLRPQGEPGRPPDPPPGRDPQARPDRGGPGRQEHR